MPLLEESLGAKFEYQDIPADMVEKAAKYRNDLIELAAKINAKPNPREMDVLLSTGEIVSSTLLSMALEAEGFRVTRVDVTRDIGRTLYDLKPDVALNALTKFVRAAGLRLTAEVDHFLAHIGHVDHSANFAVQTLDDGWRCSHGGDDAQPGFVHHIRVRVSHCWHAAQGTFAGQGGGGDGAHPALLDQLGGQGHGVDHDIEATGQQFGHGSSAAFEGNMVQGDARFGLDPFGGQVHGAADADRGISDLARF